MSVAGSRPIGRKKMGGGRFVRHPSSRGVGLLFPHRFYRTKEHEHPAELFFPDSESTADASHQRRTKICFQKSKAQELSRRPPGRAGTRKGTRQSTLPSASARRDRSRVRGNDAPSSCAHAARRPAGGPLLLTNERIGVVYDAKKRSGGAKNSLRGVAGRDGRRGRAPRPFV